MTFTIPRFPFWSANTPQETADTPSRDVNASDVQQERGEGSAEVGLGKEEEEDIDAPPAFPMLDSAQRSKVPQRHQQQSTTTTSTPAPPPEIDFDIVPPSPTPSDSSSRTLSPPPPRRHLNLASSTGTSNTLSTTPTLAPFSGTPTANAPSSLQTPPTTTKKPNPQIKKRQKVALAPGCSPLDWARVKSSGDPALRAGYGMPIRVTVDELKKHNTTTDAWSAFNGKVYNITPYLRFHPGGEKELMRCAGRDGTKLFMLTHAWVNVDYMLDTCMIGFLVPS